MRPTDCVKCDVYRCQVEKLQLIFSQWCLDLANELKNSVPNAIVGPPNGSQHSERQGRLPGQQTIGDLYDPADANMSRASGGLDGFGSGVALAPYSPLVSRGSQLSLSSLDRYAGSRSRPTRPRRIRRIAVQRRDFLPTFGSSNNGTMCDDNLGSDSRGDILSAAALPNPESYGEQMHNLETSIPPDNVQFSNIYCESGEYSNQQSDIENFNMNLSNDGIVIVQNSKPDIITVKLEPPAEVEEPSEAGYSNNEALFHDSVTVGSESGNEPGYGRDSCFQDPGRSNCVTGTGAVTTDFYHYDGPNGDDPATKKVRLEPPTEEHEATPGHDLEDGALDDGVASRSDEFVGETTGTSKSQSVDICQSLDPQQSDITSSPALEGSFSRREDSPENGDLASQTVSRALPASSRSSSAITNSASESSRRIIPIDELLINSANSIPVPFSNSDGAADVTDRSDNDFIEISSKDTVIDQQSIDLESSSEGQIYDQDLEPKRELLLEYNSETPEEFFRNLQMNNDNCMDLRDFGGRLTNSADDGLIPGAQNRFSDAAIKGHAFNSWGALTAETASNRAVFGEKIDEDHGDLETYDGTIAGRSISDNLASADGYVGENSREDYVGYAQMDQESAEQKLSFSHDQEGAQASSSASALWQSYQSAKSHASAKSNLDDDAATGLETSSSKWSQLDLSSPNHIRFPKHSSTAASASVDHLFRHDGAVASPGFGVRRVAGSNSFQDAQIRVVTPESISAATAFFSSSIFKERLAKQRTLKHIQSFLTVLGPSSYQCAICGHTFNKRGNGNRHIRGHWKLDQFKCTYCDRVLSRKDDLLKHIRGVHFKQIGGLTSSSPGSEMAAARILGSLNFGNNNLEGEAIFNFSSSCPDGTAGDDSSQIGNDSTASSSSGDNLSTSTLNQNLIRLGLNPIRDPPGFAQVPSCGDDGEAGTPSMGEQSTSGLGDRLLLQKNENG